MYIYTARIFVIFFKKYCRARCSASDHESLIYIFFFFRNEIDIDTAESILKIILQNPKEYESTERPIGRQDVFFSTLDNTKIPFNLTRADDNGAYQSRGTTKKFYR